MKSIFKNAIIAAALVFGAASISHAQVKVGDNPTSINLGSVLELESTNKGLLLPRVVLTATNVWGLAGTAVAGMTVYNTANAGTGTTKVTANTIYSWNGQSWAAIQTTLGGGKALSYATAKSSPIGVNTPNETTTCLGDVCIRFNSATTAGTATALQIKVTSPGGSVVGYTSSLFGSGGCNPCSSYNSNTLAPQDSWVSIGGGGSPALRDFSSGHIALYNSQKLYRYSVVMNGAIPANGGIAAAESSVTVFLEEIQ